MSAPSVHATVHGTLIARGALLIGALLLCLPAACTTTNKRPPASAARAGVSRPRVVRLAWLPAEPFLSRDLAATINDRLAHVTVAGTTEIIRAPLSMEVAQLAIECIEASPRCYSPVGRSLGADRLVWAELRGSSSAVRVTLVLFDVGAGAVVDKHVRTFPSVDEARASVTAMIDGAFAPPPAVATSPGPTLAKKAATP
jgi:hypothetical protein